MGDIACTFEGGEIYWRGCYRSREFAERLAEEFEHTLAGDWFAPFSQEYARQIRAAIEQYEDYHRRAA